MISTYLGQVIVSPRANRGDKMSSTNSEENRINNEESCKECGCKIIEDGDSHSHCIACGMPVKKLSFDTGYKYPSEVQEPRRTNTISSLGSQIIKDKNPISRKLIILQNRASQKKISYDEKIVAEVENTGVKGNTIPLLAEIMKIANSDNKLSTNRDILKGSKSLSNPKDRSQYKLRVYAIAGLTLLNRNLFSNSVLQIQDKWGIHKDDISNLKKFISRQLICSGYDIPVNRINSDEESSIELRNHQLSLFLYDIRDHLASYINFTSSKEIIDKAIMILSENGEPITHVSPSQIGGKFRNLSPERAALQSVVDSMCALDYNEREIKKLYKKFPVRGMKTIFSRLNAYRQNLAEDV